MVAFYRCICLPLLVDFIWPEMYQIWFHNIPLHELTFSYARFTLCSDTLATGHGLHAACSALVCQVSTVVICTCISQSCCGHKICIFMFPRISREKNNSSNSAIPDPSSLWRGSAVRLNYLCRIFRRNMALPLGAPPQSHNFVTSKWSWNGTYIHSHPPSVYIMSSMKLWHN